MVIITKNVSIFSYLILTYQYIVWYYSILIYVLVSI